ncbi:MAG: biotin/lipoyl-binding protein [Ruminococcaceae bacterium]|nr:biotin/lipoyl-binding protein [Oscillospiraceae bacterium]
MRKFSVNVNGNTYIVEVEELAGGATAPVAVPAPVAAAPAPAPVAAPAAAPAPKAPAGAEGATKIPAPMPGTVVAVKVSAGQSVKAGDVICVLEAMKMENDIVSPADGVIATVCGKGTSVNSGDTLATLN